MQLGKEVSFLTSYFSGVRDLVAFAIDNGEPDPLNMNAAMLNKFFLWMHTSHSCDAVRTARNAVANNPCWSLLLPHLPPATNTLLRNDARLAKEPRYQDTWDLKHLFKGIQQMADDDDGSILLARRIAVTLCRVYLLARGCDIHTMKARCKALGNTAIEVSIRRKMKKQYRAETLHAVPDARL